MKFKLLILLFFGLNEIGFGQSFKSPNDYIFYIKNEEINITKSTWKYTSATALKDWKKIDATRKQLIRDIQSAKKKISKIKNGYDGDVEYKNQIIQYLDLCEKNLNEEYDKIINLQDLKDQSYDAMEAFMQLDDFINAKLDSENEKVDLAYKSFALKHNIELVETESEWSKKIKIYNEVSNYHTAIYLIYFKVNFTDNNLTSAIQNADMGSIQQNTNALIQYAEEGLSQIKTIDSYNGDYSVINSANKVLEFYKKQAEEYVPKMVSFLMFYDKFENTRKIFESKSEKDRTQEEENNYNTIIKELDKEIATIKKINFKNIIDKSAVLLHWNSIGDDFIARHIPKD